MNRIGGIVVLVLGLSVAAARDEGKDKSASPAEQYKALVKEFYEAANLHSKAATDEERNQAVARVDRLSTRLLELAEKNPADPIAIEALVQVVNHELWLESNTTHPGRGKDGPQVRAIALLLRDHSRSDKLGEAAKVELYVIRHLSVGNKAPEIEGGDQDGKRFKLSDYRGKVVLLYFWQEF